MTVFFPLVFASALVAGSLSLRAQEPAGPGSALAHLEEAARMLDSIPAEKVKASDDAEEEFAALRKAFEQMSAGYRSTSVSVAANATTQRGPDAPIDWRTKFSEVERKLAALVGGGRSLDGTSVKGGAVTPVGVDVPATPGAVGTAGTVAASGNVAAPAVNAGDAQAVVGAGTVPGLGAAVAVSTVGIEELDPGVRRQLHDFRREVELFFLATFGSRSVGVAPR